MVFFKKSFIKYAYHWLTASKSESVHHCMPEAKDDDQQVAIYCVHGTADHPSAFSNIVKHIKSKLVPEVESIHQPSFNGRFQLHDIAFFANQLKNKIIANKHKKIILIGHSRGALVASYFTEYLANENDIEVDVTINICGPFGGTDWAMYPLTYSASVNQMRSESPFLRNLTQKMKSSGNTYYYFSASKDELVLPSQAFIKEHAKYVVALDGDHFSIMQSVPLANYITDIINNVILEKAAYLEQSSYVFDHPRPD